jgi:hypothetical protein
LNKRKLGTRCLLTLILICLGVAASAKTVSSPAYRAGSFDDAIADSTLDFSATQGSKGWSYGYWVDGDAPARFAPFDSCKDGVWRRKGSPMPSVTRAGLSSGPVGLVPVRRWTASQAGSVRLVGWLRKPANTGDRVTCRVYVAGKERWSRVLDGPDTIPHAFDILLYDVPKGAPVDMAVLPGRKTKSADVIWKLQILSEPCTAWRPDLPIGPVFTDAEKAQQREAGVKLLARINEASKNKDGKLVIVPGNYRFSADWGPHPVLTDLHDLTLIAHGVTFWFDPPDIWGLEFTNCSNVKVYGLTLDYDPLPTFQAHITAIDTKANTVTAELMKGYEPPEQAGQRVVCLYRADGSYIQNYLLNKTWRRLPGTSTIVVDTPAPGAKVGDYLACPTRTGQALRCSGCGGMVFEDCNIYASGGGVIGENGGAGGNVYRRLHATRRPGTNRLHAFGADGFHLSSTDKGAIIDRCEMAYLGDDHINIHGFFSTVGKRLGPAHYYLLGYYAPFEVGKRIYFWDWSTVEPRGSAVVVSVKPVSDGSSRAEATKEIVAMNQPHSEEVSEVTLDEDVDLPTGTLIDTRNHECRGFVVKNCWFHDCFNRAFLLNGSPDGLIENNTLQNVGGGINIHFETWAYIEGRFASNTMVRNNRILDCATGPADANAYFQGAIMIVLVPNGGNYLRHSTPVSNMTLTGNYIENAGGVPVYVTNMDGLTVTHNTIDRPFSWSGWKGFGKAIANTCGDLPDAPVFLATVKNARISDNLVYDPAGFTGGRTVRTGPLTSNISVDNQMLWDCAADFITGWTPDGAQDQSGWSYGCTDSTLVSRGQYSPTAFVRFGALDANRWRLAPKSESPYVSRISMLPSASKAAVKRWVSTISGKARIEGALQDGKGSKVYVFVDGMRKWQQDTSDGKTNAIGIDLDNLNVGSIVDFVVSSDGSSTRDATNIYAKITAPHQASSP